MSEALQAAATELLRVRYAQIVINEYYKQQAFKVPVHLALGHEAIAVAVNTCMHPGDQLVLTHRNIHYHLARQAPLQALIDEYQLQSSGLAQAHSGSMNLTWPEQGLVYTSSILGNNFSVACGLALAHQTLGQQHMVVVVTGDGAIEEGAFYESLVFLKTHALPVLVLIENNNSSLATTIAERRCDIDLNSLSRSLEIPYYGLSDNHILSYQEQLAAVRTQLFTQPGPVCLEVNLTTLGDYTLTNADHPQGKWINYHAGPAPEVRHESDLILRNDASDPLFVLSQMLSAQAFTALSKTTQEAADHALSGLL